MDAENAEPTAADLDAVAEEQKAKEATADDGKSIDPEASKEAPAPASFRTGVAGGPHTPSNDSDVTDSQGNPKSDTFVPVGARGDNAPPDVLTDAQKKAAEAAHEARLQAGMSSTDHKDSVGNAKGTQFEPHQPLIGPRGTGTPKESYSSLKQ